MDYLDLLKILANVPLPVILLAAVIFLYREKQKADAALVVLLERYHKGMEDQIHTLVLINEKLDKK